MKGLVKSECIDFKGIHRPRLPNDLHLCSKDSKSVEAADMLYKSQMIPADSAGCV